MKWNNIVAKAIKDGASSKLLNGTLAEMHNILEYVKDMEPGLYWDFKSAVLRSLNGSGNSGFDIDDDTYNIYRV